MAVAHDQLELGGPGPVVLAEPAVLEPLGVGGFVLLPEQKQGDALALELAVHPRPVRHRACGTGQIRGRRIQGPLQGRVIERGGPADARPAGALQAIPHRALADADAARNGALAVTGGTQPQHFSDLSHGQPRCRHLVSSQVIERKTVPRQLSCAVGLPGIGSAG